MKIHFLLLASSIVLLSCGDSSSEEGTESKLDEGKAQHGLAVDETVDFDIVGKWALYEDEDLEKKKGTFIFKEKGEMIMIENSKNQNKGIYEFDSEFMTLSLSDRNGESTEIVDVEIVDNDNVLLKGRHVSGNEFTSLLVRKN